MGKTKQQILLDAREALIEMEDLFHSDNTYTFHTKEIDTLTALMNRAAYLLQANTQRLKE